MTQRKTVGFIGVGTMGRPMATHLLGRGHDVLVHDISTQAQQAMVDAGARGASGIRAVCDEAAVVFTSLPSPAVFAEVMLGEGGVGSGAAVKIVVDLSTVGPRAARAAAEGLLQRGITLVDAPVSGGAAGAREARLTVMVSGPAHAVASVTPLLEVFGILFVVGQEAGQAQLLKLLNNMLSSTAFAITAEAFVAGVKGGLDPATMLEVINASSGRSAASQEKFVRQVLPRSFDFGFPISSICKDIGLAVDECEALGVPMWVGSQARQLWNFARKQGGGGLDMTELVTLMETWAQATPPVVQRRE
jgi:2-hydroxy-3-oxopropionate reductase